MDIDILMEAIHEHCSSLPETALEIKKVRSMYDHKTNQKDSSFIPHPHSLQHSLNFWQIIVKMAYNCVSKVYLECLLKTKFRKLEKLWGNAEEKIKEDVQRFHKTFSELVKKKLIYFHLYFWFPDAFDHWKSGSNNI